MISEGAKRLIDLMASGKSEVEITSATEIPYTEWPLWAKALAKLSRPEDKGIGDVVHRLIGDENSVAFKTWYKKITGRDCGCKGRRTQWNIQFPL